MIKANSATEIKIATLELIKLDNKHNKKVVKSLKKWAAKILCWENNYVQDLANADDETKICMEGTKTHGKKQYLMMQKNYKPNQQQPGGNVDIVKDFSIEKQQCKSPHQLFLHLGKYTMEEIEKLSKATSKKN